jgi:hypothetical protein
LTSFPPFPSQCGPLPCVQLGDVKRAPFALPPLCNASRHHQSRKYTYTHVLPTHTRSLTLSIHDHGRGRLASKQTLAPAKAAERRGDHYAICPLVPVPSLITCQGGRRPCQIVVSLTRWGGADKGKRQREKDCRRETRFENCFPQFCSLPRFCCPYAFTLYQPSSLSRSPCRAPSQKLEIVHSILNCMC